MHPHSYIFSISIENITIITIEKHDTIIINDDSDWKKAFESPIINRNWELTTFSQVLIIVVETSDWHFQRYNNF